MIYKAGEIYKYEGDISTSGIRGYFERKPGVEVIMVIRGNEEKSKVFYTVLARTYNVYLPFTNPKTKDLCGVFEDCSPYSDKLQTVKRTDLPMYIGLTYTSQTFYKILRGDPSYEINIGMELDSVYRSLLGGKKIKVDAYA